MKIALHVGQLHQPVPGGIARYVRALLRELPQLGVDTVAFASGERPRGVAANIEYHNLGWPHGSVRYELWHRFRRPIVDAPGELVHAPSLAVPAVRDRPLLVTAHDIAFHRFPRTTTPRGRAFHERGLEQAKRHATLVLAPSEFTRGELIDIGFAPERVRTVYLGTQPPEDLDDATTKQRLARLRMERPFIVTVGTVEPRKRLHLLVQAHQALRQQFPDLELAIVGPAGWGDIGELEAPGVRRFGALPWAAVDALYRGAVACAIPSIYEGFGLPAVEAMGRSCPVVTVRGSALEEVVADAGTLVPPDDVAALTDGLARLIADDHVRQAHVVAGRARAAMFTWARSAREHASIYTDVIAAATRQ